MSQAVIYTDIGVLLWVAALGMGCYRQAVPVLLSTKGLRGDEWPKKGKERSHREQGLRGKQIQITYEEKVLQ